MKVKVNLTNQTLECLDNKPYIQGYDTRNKLIVYVDASVTLTNIQIAYQLQNGRNTIKLPNNGIVEATLEDETTPNPDYIEGYNGFIFNAFTNAGEPLAVTNQAGNFTATLVFKVGGNTYKLNVLNTVLKSTDFEEFENAVEGVAQEVLHSLESMSDTVAELQQTVDDIAANDFSEDEAKEIFYTKTQSDSKYAKFKLVTNVANIPVETLESLEIGDILVSGAYAYMVLKGLQAQNSAYNRFIYGIEDTSTLKVYWYEKTSVSGTDWYLRILTYPLARYSSTDKLNADYIQDGSTNKVFTGTEKTKLSGIEAGAEVNTIEGVKVNGTAQTPDANKIISLTIPTQASDVNALPNSTKYCASCALEINSSTYVMSLQLKDQNGNNLGTAKTIDLPLETMVVSGSYDSATKKVVLTLQNGQTVEFSVADLVSGLQTEITAQNKLSSDLVDDTGHTHKFATAEQLAQIETNKNAISGKVDKVTGKGLSTNDYTNEDKAVVEGLNSVATTTTTTANVIDVPTSAKGLATLKRIGGMSYKCKNLLPTQYSSNFTIAGDTYINYPISKGTYTIKPTNSGVNGTIIIKDINGNDLYNEGWRDGLTFTINSDGCYIQRFWQNGTITTNIMLNTGSTALPYEEHFDGIHDSAVAKVESVGANRFDKTKATNGKALGEWTLFDGANISTSNVISVKPNTSYTLSYVRVLCFGDINGDYISGSRQYLEATNYSFTTPSNCYCIRFDIPTEYLDAIMLNKGSTALPYAPYKTYELAIPQAIRSITGYGWGVNENCYNYLELSLNEYKPFKQFAGRVDLGSLNWIYITSDTNPKFQVQLGNAKGADGWTTQIPNILCSNYTATSWSEIAENTTLDKAITIAPSKDIAILDRNYTDATAFKQAMSGVYLYYELATPVITDISSLLDEVHIPIEANGTLELVNTHNNAVPVIVSFDNGLADMVKTNHNHDIEQQKEIEKLEQYKASKESLLDKMSYNEANNTLTISLGVSGDSKSITFTDNELFLKAYSDTIGTTTVSLDEDKIVLKYQTDFEEDNITHTLKLDQNGLTYDNSPLGAYYIHNIHLTCSNSEVSGLNFKLIRRINTPLTLADLKEEVVSKLKALDVMVEINNGNGIVFYSPIEDMSFYDSSETSMAFNVVCNIQLNDKTLSYDGLDVAVAEVINVDDTVVEL